MNALMTKKRALLEKWRKVDPTFNQFPEELGMEIAQIQENQFNAMAKNPHGFGFRLEGEVRDHLMQMGADPDVKAMRSELARASGGRFTEDTTTADVATTALQILPTVTRAFVVSPFLSKGLVATRGLDTPSANIPILDFTYGTAGGAYAADTRVDNNEDPTYSDSTDCIASPREIDASITRETVSVSLKKLGNDTCLPAIDWASSQWRIDLKSMLRDMIFNVMVREWARNVSDVVRTMASFSGTWSATPPSPYNSLNTNEWRAVLAETLVTLDASVRGAIYEPTEWLVWTPAVAAILERRQRPIVNMIPGSGSTNDAQSLQFATGEFGETYERWEAYQDPYLAANTIVGGRRTLKMTPTPVDPCMFLVYQMLNNVSFLLYPKDQRIEMGGQTQATIKMLVPLAFFVLTVTA